MKTKKNAELSTEELTKKLKQQKTIFNFLLIMWFFVYCFLIGLFIWKGSKISIATIVPLFILPITLLPVYISGKEMKKELQNRKD